MLKSGKGALLGMFFPVYWPPTSAQHARFAKRIKRLTYTYEVIRRSPFKSGIGLNLFPKYHHSFQFCTSTVYDAADKGPRNIRETGVTKRTTKCTCLWMLLGEKMSRNLVLLPEKCTRSIFIAKTSIFRQKGRSFAQNHDFLLRNVVKSEQFLYR